MLVKGARLLRDAKPSPEPMRNLVNITLKTHVHHGISNQFVQANTKKAKLHITGTLWEESAGWPVGSLTKG